MHSCCKQQARRRLRPRSPRRFRCSIRRAIASRPDEHEWRWGRSQPCVAPLRTAISSPLSDAPCAFPLRRISLPVPFAMLGVETKVHRRQWMKAFLVVGTITSVALLVAIMRGPVGAVYRWVTHRVLSRHQLRRYPRRPVHRRDLWRLPGGKQQVAGRARPCEPECGNRARLDHLHGIHLALVRMGGADIDRDCHLPAPQWSCSRTVRGCVRGTELVLSAAFGNLNNYSPIP